MAYTNVWSTTSPANGDPASGAAADIRKVRVDLYERMLSLGIDLSNDPIIVLDGDNYLYVHWSQFQVIAGASLWTVNIGVNHYGVSPDTGAASYTMLAPLMLPRGVEITEIVVFGKTATSGTITINLKRLDMTSGSAVPSTLATVAIAADQNQKTETTGAISVTLDSTGATNLYFYYVECILVENGTGDTQFQGVKIKYERDNLLQVI